MKIEFKNISSNKRNFEINSDNYINDEEILIAIDGKFDDNMTIQEIKEMYFKFGENIVNKINGYFSIYIFDKQKDIVLLIKDKVGLKPIYYYEESNSIYCGNDLMNLVNTFNIKK